MPSLRVGDAEGLEEIQHGMCSGDLGTLEPASAVFACCDLAFPASGNNPHWEVGPLCKMPTPHPQTDKLWVE